MRKWLKFTINCEATSSVPVVPANSFTLSASPCKFPQFNCVAFGYAIGYTVNQWCIYLSHSLKRKLNYSSTENVKRL